MRMMFGITEPLPFVNIQNKHINIMFQGWDQTNHRFITDFTFLQNKYGRPADAFPPMTKGS
jgi:hypothetical protein